MTIQELLGSKTEEWCEQINAVDHYAAEENLSMVFISYVKAIEICRSRNLYMEKKNYKSHWREPEWVFFKNGAEYRAKYGDILVNQGNAKCAYIGSSAWFTPQKCLYVITVHARDELTQGDFEQISRKLRSGKMEPIYQDYIEIRGVQLTDIIHTIHAIDSQVTRWSTLIIYPDHGYADELFPVAHIAWNENV